MPKKLAILFSIFVLFCLPSGLFAQNLMKAGAKSQPMTINGDTVEYSADSQEVTASGNVEIISGDSRLTCEKLTVNTQTKQGMASGHARLEDSKGVIEGEKLIYNFQNKTGTIVDAQFRASPFFGKARNIDKESEKEFIAHYGYITTCSFDRPHYRIVSKQINVVPKELIQTKDDYIYLSTFPLMYFARFNQMFDKPIMHVSVLPGKRKDWGPYLLSVWEYNLSDALNGRGYLDYRNKLGWSEGFGINYMKTPVGNGDLKFYYTDEDSGNHSSSSDTPTSFQRYLLRFRQKWDIDNQTNLVSEVYKIKDDKRKKHDPQSSFLQDYFYREFEKDSQPLNYGLFHHSFAYSSFDLLLQKRTNHWYDQLDKLPQATFTLPSIKIGDSPFYFDNSSTFVTFNKMAVIFPTTADDLTVSRFDTTNKISLPMRVAFLRVSPFVKVQETVYDKGVDSSTLPGRSAFFTGADVSTNFYRVFDVKTNVLGLDLNGLRHVITPSIGYSYNPEPTVSSNKLLQIDSVDLLTSNNSAALGLVNKLQTKRKDKNGKEVSVDVVDFDVTATYAFAPRIVFGTTNTTFAYNDSVVTVTDPTKKNKFSNSTLSDIYFKCKILPYAWMRIEGEATYKHSGVPGDTDYANYNHFSTADYDIYFDFAPERSFSLGQRYARKGQNQITVSFQWRLNPKWKFSIYERYNLKTYTDTSLISNPTMTLGSLEQELTFSRNLHCWDVDFVYNTKVNMGSSLYIIFRLKAFPENEFGFNHSFREPKSP